MQSDDPQYFEIELLKKIAQGDRQSFSELYDRFVRVLFSTAMIVTRQREIAEEVVQDVFVQIWKKASLYNPGRGKPLTWAIVLTRNRAIDRMRALQRQNRAMEETKEELPVSEPADFRNSFHIAAMNESSARVREALKSLSDRQRKAIELVFVKGMTMSEVAKSMGEALPTIKGRVRRGLLRLRELLREKI